jgi:hypothetical protein
MLKCVEFSIRIPRSLLGIHFSNVSINTTETII